MLHRCARRAPHRPGPSLPTKKPAAQNAAGFEVDTAGSREACFRVRDGSPASTVRCNGWNHEWCRRLLRCACSLASAGNVCWAKPNHAFFRCQQSFAKFFSGAQPAQSCSTAMMVARRVPRSRDGRTHAMHASPVRKRWCGPQRFDVARAHAAASAARQDERVHAARRGVAHRRVGPLRISRRTSVFARKLRELFRAHPRAGHAIDDRRNKKTRGVSVAGFRWRQANDAQWSSSSSSSA